MTKPKDISSQTPASIMLKNHGEYDSYSLWNISPAPVFKVVLYWQINYMQWHLLIMCFSEIVKTITCKAPNKMKSNLPLTYMIIVCLRHSVSAMIKSQLLCAYT